MTQLSHGETVVPGKIVPGTTEILKLSGICKRFPGVDALTDVNFDLRSGEVHILFGENGAGKSTLISTISGAAKPTTGTISYLGEQVDFQSVYDARQLGISAVFQEFSLIPQLSIAENILLGRETTRGIFLEKRLLRVRAQTILNRLGFALDINSLVSTLSRAERQMVEIAKAFSTEPSILILDEPTASLTERETAQLFELIELLKQSGVAIIYITHRMGEIHQIGDRITILRDGRVVSTVEAAEVDDDRLIELMTGRKIDQVFPAITNNPGKTLLEIDDLKLADVDFEGSKITVRAGEVVGIAGLVGSGKGETGRACYGLEKILRGNVIFDGENVTGSSIFNMLERGMAYVPSDRHDEGLVLNSTVRENISLSVLRESEYAWKGFLRLRNEKSRTNELATIVDLRPFNTERHVEQFSGGNQQKVMIAKLLARNVKLAIFDEPTVGVDVGTRTAIYEQIRDLCEAGVGVLLISSDLPEILHLTHRTYVMYRGQLSAELLGDDITEDNILQHFFERTTDNENN